LHLQQIFQTHSAFYQNLLGIVQFPLDQGKAIATNVISDDSLGASDGSCLNNTLASFAVKLSPRDAIADTPNPLAFTSGHGVDGAPGHITSLRAESRGGIATILICLILYKKWPTSFETVNQILDTLTKDDCQLLSNNLYKKDHHAYKDEYEYASSRKTSYEEDHGTSSIVVTRTHIPHTICTKPYTQRKLNTIFNFDKDWPIYQSCKVSEVVAGSKKVYWCWEQHFNLLNTF
jgi:hypothetical protein